MSVVRVVEGVVTQTWRDVKTIQDAVAKYGLDPTGLYEADHPAGTQHDGTVFYTPTPTPLPTPVHRFEEAIQILLEGANPSVQARVAAALRRNGE